MISSADREIKERLKKLYKQDLQLWIEQTIQQLQNCEFETLDTENLIEELIDLGKSNQGALESNLEVLLAHLLKLKIQQDAPDTMKGSWDNSVNEHRARVKKQLKKTPSLKAYWDTAIEEAYSDGRKLVIKDSKNAKFGVSTPSESDYPILCPFSQEQILDEDFYGL